MFKAEEIGKKKEYFKEKSKTKQNKATWTGANMLAAEKDSSNAVIS
jgi:hypothetical protein